MNIPKPRLAYQEIRAWAPGLSLLILAAAMILYRNTIGAPPLSASTGPVAMEATIHEFRTIDGNKKLQAEFVETVDSSGNQRMLKRVFLGSKQDELSALNLSKITGEFIQAVPQLRIKSTIYRPTQLIYAEQRNRLNPATSCVEPMGVKSLEQRVLAGGGSILNFPTNIVEAGGVGKNGMKKTFHYAPSLNCFPLFHRVEVYDQNGKLSETVDKQAVSIKTSDIKLNLDETSGFTELKPSQMKLAVAKYLGLAECPACMSAAIQREDKVYEQGRVKSRV
jgi:hypothetical protein